MKGSFGIKIFVEVQTENYGGGERNSHFPVQSKKFGTLHIPL